VGGTSVEVGDGIIVAVKDGWITMISEGPGVGGARKLQAGKIIRITIKKSFRIY
jgi:hypothetical protein